MNMSTETTSNETKATPAADAPSKRTIAVSEKAVSAMRAQLEKRGTPGAAIRVGVRGGGCSGFSYVIEFDDNEPRKGDLVLEFPEEGKSTVRVFCDKGVSATGKRVIVATPPSHAGRIRYEPALLAKSGYGSSEQRCGAVHSTNRVCGCA